MAQSSPVSASSPPDPRSGALYALLAYGAWGLLPIYWKFLGISPAVFLILILLVQRRLPDLVALLRQPRRVGVLLITASLLSVNWGMYIYGVNSDQVVEASLGYFINPLVTVLLGFVVLKERLHPLQWLAVALAAAGVGYFVVQFGTVPWIALGLAITFAFYGLLRKVVPVAPLVGLAVETLLITPFTLAFVSYLGLTGQGHFGQSLPITLLFMGAGVATSMPLLWFNNAAKRLPLATLGFFQYLAPSIALLLGVLVYREPFTPTHLITFGCIWAALTLYTVTAWRQKVG